MLRALLDDELEPVPEHDRLDDCHAGSADEDEVAETDRRLAALSYQQPGCPR